MANVIRSISENGGVIFCAIDSTSIAQEMERIHKTSALASAALGRLLTAASLMGVMLKHPSNSITLRLSGGGPLGTVLAVSDGDGNVRGTVQNPLVELPFRPDGKLDVGGGVGANGTLSVVKDLGMKEPYVGQVPLVSGEVAEDITSYYATSEQIPTVCALGVLVDKDLSILKAGGYLLQLLPGATEEEITLLENNVAAMPSVTQMLCHGLSLEDMMHKALQGFDPSVLDWQDTLYLCDCSYARVERAVLSLGRAELTKIAKEQGVTQVTCQFCDKVYELQAEKLLESLAEPDIG